MNYWCVNVCTMYRVHFMVVTKVLLVSELFSSLYRTLFSDMNSQCRLGLYSTVSHTAGY